MKDKIIHDKHPFKITLKSYDLVMKDGTKVKDRGYLEVKTSDDVKNVDICDLIDNYAFKTFTILNSRSFMVKIRPNDKIIEIYPFIDMEVSSKDDGFSKFEMTVDEKMIPDKDLKKYLAEFSVEMTLDFWNKFHITQFGMVTNDRKVLLIMNGGLNDKQLKGYFMKHDTDGYNLKASFWQRNWLREDQKLNITKGAKQ